MKEKTKKQRKRNGSLTSADVSDNWNVVHGSGDDQVFKVQGSEEDAFETDNDSRNTEKRTVSVSEMNNVNGVGQKTVGKSKTVPVLDKPSALDVSSMEETLTPFLSVDKDPPHCTIEIDFTAVCVFLIAIATRMWRLEEPRSIVFDELHYGKFASLYMKRTFFFDSHPPLGKQLIALAGYLAGFDGNASFERIGGGYSPSLPLWTMRAVPAFFGSLLVPVVYYTVKELGLSYRTALLASIFIIIENSFLTQSRFILMESMLLFFSVFGLFAMLKFRKIFARSFSFPWWFWMTAASVSTMCALCIKYSGGFSFALVVVILGYDYWQMIADHSLTNKRLLLHLVARIFALLAIPILIYLGTFYVHLAWLTKAGPHDNIMTSAFQASLEGGLASITKGQPLIVAHGSQITLRHTHGRACWLHSHAHVYPVRYPDKRGSSHQQQVTCYSFKDVNNWWIVKRPERNDLVASEPLDKIKHGDIIQLIHGISSRALNSHDVAAPMSPQHQEVSCYIDYNISFPAQNLWKVDIVNKDTEGDVWHTIHSHVRLLHVNSSQALKFSGKQLPEWGFNQHEVVTDRVLNQDDTVWNVEEHRYTKSGDQKEREREMGLAEFVPLQPTQLSFFEKLWELQYKMLSVNQENVQDHVYSSEPMDWLVMRRGIAYWISPYSNAQIYLLGNVVVWYSATAGMVLYGVFMIVYLLRRRRACYDIPADVWEKFCMVGLVLTLGYLLHLLPHIFADRTLFLHHYLPACLFKLMFLAAVFEHIDFLLWFFTKSWVVKWLYCSFVAAWLSCAIYVFFKFSVFCYGTTALSAQDVQNLRWKETWDFIIHRF